jgi:hypothetical protein
MVTTAGILAFIALLCFVASLFPQVPEKHTSAVGGILLSVALLVAGRA